MTDAELSRERNDLYFGSADRSSYGDYGAGSTPHEPRFDDETGRYAVVVTDTGAVVRDRTIWATRGHAERMADHHRETLEAAGSDASVEIIDLTEEEQNAAR